MNVIYLEFRYNQSAIRV